MGMFSLVHWLIAAAFWCTPVAIVVWLVRDRTRELARGGPVGALVRSRRLDDDEPGRRRRNDDE